jgi:parallel beta-helix repeat protein
MSDNILINYKKAQSWTRTDTEDIGATTSTTLRTITTPAAGTTNYVRKYGEEYKITQITGDNYIGFMGGGNVLTWRFYGAETSTLLYTIVDNAGAVTVTPGSTLSTAEQLKVVATFGDSIIVVPAGKTFDINTDIDVGGLSLYFSNEDTSNNNDIVTWYIAANGYSYYDQNLTYGGYRHTPAVGNENLPYFDIESANAALGSRTIVHVLDSEEYFCKDLSPTDGKTWQAALGQTPTLYRSVGFNQNNVPFTDITNYNTIFVDYINGNDSNNGAHDYPRKTIGASVFSRNTGFVSGGAKYVCIISDGEIIETANNVNSSTTTNETYKIVSAPKKNPIIKLNLSSGWWFSVNDVGVYVEMYNLKVNINGNNLVAVSTSVFTPANTTVIQDCTFYNSTNNQIFSFVKDATFSRCHFYNNTSTQTASVGGSGASGQNYIIRDSLFHNNGTGPDLQPNVTTSTILIDNNICYNNTQGISFTYTSGNTLIIAHNTCSKNTYGIWASAATTPTIVNNISYGNVKDLHTAGGSQTITYSVYLTSDYVDGGNNSTQDPDFIDASNNNFFVNSDSVAYRTADDGKNKGCRRLMLIIPGNNITINGFIFDSNSDCDTVIWQAGTRTGCIYKWLTLDDCCSIAIDNFATGDTTTTVSNCIISNNQDGILMSKGGNTINKCLLANLNKNLYINGSNNNLTKNTVGAGVYGIWFDSGSISDNVITDTVSGGNSLWNLKSDYDIYATYSCFGEKVSNVVTLTRDGMVNDNPLFINTTAGTIDLHYKRKEEGFLFDSSCLDAASDSTDIGAYIVSYLVSSYSWRKYQFENNPIKNSHYSMVKNVQTSDNILGGTTVFVDGWKRKFPMEFPNFTTENQRLKIQYLNSFHPSRTNSFTRDDTIMRYHLLPDTLLESGTSATLNHASYWDTIDNKVLITDTSKTWVENQFRGFHLSVEFDSATSAVISASAKTITKSGAFTGDDWTGYFVYINGYYYYIASNTNDALTVLDPDSTLVDSTKDIKVEKYFKILENDVSTMYIYDPDNELSGLDGSYDYVIDFIEVVVETDDQKHSQPRYSETEERTKYQYQLYVEEA